MPPPPTVLNSDSASDDVKHLTTEASLPMSQPSVDSDGLAQPPALAPHLSQVRPDSQRCTYPSRPSTLCTWVEQAPRGSGGAR